MEDYVIVEAVHSPSNMFKWKATKVTLSNNGRDYPTLKTIMNSRTEPGKPSLIMLGVTSVGSIILNYFYMAHR